LGVFYDFSFPQQHFYLTLGNFLSKGQKSQGLLEMKGSAVKFKAP
jgi:hypothetical protein